MRSLGWICSIIALVACHRRGVDYIAPPGENSREPALGRVDVALASALRAAYVRSEREPPPVQLASDGSELELRELAVSVATDGVLAHTELHFTFHNPEPRVREGRFSIALPPDSTIARFAMLNDSGWREARVVSRSKGREVYERFLHRRVDPALLEKDAGNQFTARVFPIAASADKQIVIAYDDRVPASGPYVVPLHGLPRLDTLSFAVDRDGHHESRVQRGVIPDDLELSTTAAANAVASGEDFVARIATQPDATATAPLDHVAVLVDTSASRAALMGRQAKLVRELLAAMPADTDVSVLAFDQVVTEVYRGRADGGDGVDRRLLDEGALGASDLGAALARTVAIGARRVIIVGDGSPTTGEADPAKLAAIVRGSNVVRADAIQVGQTIDRDTLVAIVRAGQRPGEIIQATSGAALVHRLSSELAADVAIRVDGATAVWPATTHAVAPGDAVWIFGRRPAAANGTPLVIHFGGRSTTVRTATGDARGVARAVAGAELAELSEHMATASGDERRVIGERIEVLALAHDLISARTSLIVLESDRDERVFLDGKPPTIDPTSTTQGITIDKSYLENIPVPGRTFESALGAAAGSQGDDLGVSFSGSTSLENQYYVDGVNTTGGCCSGGPSEPEYARPYRPRTAEIMTAIRRRETSRAVALALAWHLESPGDVAAILALGEALEARGATVAAARAYGSLVDLFPNRAEMLRAAGERLDRVPGARAMAIDAYRRALHERPDQVSTYRLLAYDLMLDDDPTALDVVFDGMKHTSRGSVQDILTGDNHDIAAYLLVHAPAAADYVRARVRGTLPRKPLMRIVLSWETDANDVDLHVRDARGGHAWFQDRALPSGGRLLDDLTDGYGPEMFEVDSPAAFPYRVGVHYYNRGPEGVGLGSVHIIRSDGAGNVSVETRPFVLENDNAMIELGTIPR